MVLLNKIKDKLRINYRKKRWPGLINAYKQYLPVTKKTPIVTLNEGNTPLILSESMSKIIGNGTIPHFYKLQDCPPKTLHNFPKELILKCNKQKPKDSYNDVVLELLDYMKSNLTTKKLAEYVLS